MRDIWMDFPLLPRQASTLASRVDALTLAWTLIAAFFSLLIAGLILFFFVRYRRRSPLEVGRPPERSFLLEMVWIAVPLVISLAMFVWGVDVYVETRRPPADAFEYFAFAKQWMWKFQHPDGHREINELHVPVDQPIKLTLTSEDVIHSFFVPAFRVKTDVLPGRYSTVWFEATATGTYHLFCSEYCGAEHSLMKGSVHVMEPRDYEDWLAGERTTGGPSPLGEGEALFVRLDCIDCHGGQDAARGPALTGIFGSEVLTAAGRRVVADEEYLRESILRPAAQVVAGYQALMPPYAGQVSEEEVLTLINYIKSLEPAAADRPPQSPSGG